MSNRMKKLRKSAFESSLPDAPTDSLVAAYFSLPLEFSEEEQKLMYARYVEKAFKKLHPRKVVHLEEKWPLGRWLEKIRSYAHLTQEDVADALGQSIDYFAKIETEEIPPWEIPSREAAKLAILFCLHVDALAEMAYASHAVRESRKRLPNDLRALGFNTVTNGPSVDLAIDLYYARNSPSAEALPQIEKWLSEVRDDMKKEARARKMQQNMRKS